MGDAADDETDGASPQEIGFAFVQLHEPVHELVIDERGPRPFPPPPRLVLPDACACCGMPAHGEARVPNAARGAQPVALPSCSPCEGHLRPNPARPVTVAFWTCLVLALLAWLATKGTVAGIALILVLVVGLPAAILEERRVKRPLPEWPAPDGIHCGPMWVFRIGNSGAYRGQHRSWLRRLHALNARDFDAKIRFEPEPGER